MQSKAESVSKYFTRNSKDETEPASAYSNNLTKIKKITLNDDDDFKTPKPVKKLAKIFENPAKTQAQSKAKRKVVKRGRPAKKDSMQKTIEDAFKTTDVHGEHMQMAIALSVSAQEAQKAEMIENNQDAGDDNDDEWKPVLPSTQEVRENVKHTLEQYGFKSRRTNNSANEFFVAKNTEGSKRKKKSRYHYVKPILFLRTEEDRKEIINQKIAQILTQLPTSENQTKLENPSLHSKILREYHHTSRSAFNKNNIPESQLRNDLFYLEKLELSPSKFKCGGLLKKWEEIPGRELSPIRNFTDVNKEFNCKWNEKNIVSQELGPARNFKCVNEEFNREGNEKNIEGVNEQFNYKQNENNELSPVKNFKCVNEEFNCEGNEQNVGQKEVGRKKAWEESVHLKVTEVQRKNISESSGGNECVPQKEDEENNGENYRTNEVGKNYTSEIISQKEDGNYRAEFISENYKAKIISKKVVGENYRAKIMNQIEVENDNANSFNQKGAKKGSVRENYRGTGCNNKKEAEEIKSHEEHREMEEAEVILFELYTENECHKGNACISEREVLEVNEKETCGKNACISESEVLKVGEHEEYGGKACISVREEESEKSMISHVCLKDSTCEDKNSACEINYEMEVLKVRENEKYGEKSEVKPKISPVCTNVSTCSNKSSMQSSACEINNKNTTNNIMNTKTEIASSRRIIRSQSPDLFESDEDTLEYKDEIISVSPHIRSKEGNDDGNTLAEKHSSEQSFNKNVNIHSTLIEKKSEDNFNKNVIHSTLIEKKSEDSFYENPELIEDKKSISDKFSTLFEINSDNESSYKKADKYLTLTETDFNKNEDVSSSDIAIKNVQVNNQLSFSSEDETHETKTRNKKNITKPQDELSSCHTESNKVAGCSEKIAHKSEPSSKKSKTLDNIFSASILSNLQNSSTELSDDCDFSEELCLKKSKAHDNVFSASLLSNLHNSSAELSDDCEIIETDNGICHFESFCADEETLSQKCMNEEMLSRNCTNEEMVSHKYMNEEMVLQRKISSQDEQLLEKCINEKMLTRKNIDEEKCFNEEMLLQKKTSSQTCTNEEMLSKESIRDKKILKNYANEEMLSKKCTSEELLSQKCTSEDFLSQKCTNEEIPLQKYANSNVISQNGRNQNILSQKCTNEETLSQKCNSQNCTNEIIPSQKCTSEEKPSQKFTNEEILLQKYTKIRRNEILSQKCTYEETLLQKSTNEKIPYTNTQVLSQKGRNEILSQKCTNDVTISQKCTNEKIPSQSCTNDEIMLQKCKIEIISSDEEDFENTPKKFEIKSELGDDIFNDDTLDADSFEYYNDGELKKGDSKEIIEENKQSPTKNQVFCAGEENIAENKQSSIKKQMFCGNKALIKENIEQNLCVSKEKIEENKQNFCGNKELQNCYNNKEIIEVNKHLPIKKQNFRGNKELIEEIKDLPNRKQKTHAIKEIIVGDEKCSKDQHEKIIKNNESLNLDITLKNNESLIKKQNINKASEIRNSNVCIDEGIIVKNNEYVKRNYSICSDVKNKTSRIINHKNKVNKQSCKTADGINIEINVDNKSNISDNLDDSHRSKLSNSDSSESVNTSDDSIYISDEELNYSSAFSKSIRKEFISEDESTELDDSNNTDLNESTITNEEDWVLNEEADYFKGSDAYEKPSGNNQLIENIKNSGHCELSENNAFSKNNNFSGINELSENNKASENKALLESSKLSQNKNSSRNNRLLENIKSSGNNEHSENNKKSPGNNDFSENINASENNELLESTKLSKNKKSSRNNELSENTILSNNKKSPRNNEPSENNKSLGNNERLENNKHLENKKSSGNNEFTDNNKSSGNNELSENNKHSQINKPSKNDVPSENNKPSVRNQILGNNKASRNNDNTENNEASDSNKQLKNDTRLENNKPSASNELSGNNSLFKNNKSTENNKLAEKNGLSDNNELLKNKKETSENISSISRLETICISDEELDPPNSSQEIINFNFNNSFNNHSLSSTQQKTSSECINNIHGQKPAKKKSNFEISDSENSDEEQLNKDGCNNPGITEPEQSNSSQETNNSVNYQSLKSSRQKTVSECIISNSYVQKPAKKKSKFEISDSESSDEEQSNEDVCNNLGITAILQHIEFHMAKRNKAKGITCDESDDDIQVVENKCDDSDVEIVDEGIQNSDAKVVRNDETLVDERNKGAQNDEDSVAESDEDSGPGRNKYTARRVRNEENSLAESDQDTVARRNKYTERRVQDGENSVAQNDEDSLARRNKYTERRVLNDEDSLAGRNKHTESRVQNEEDSVAISDEDSVSRTNKYTQRRVQNEKGSVADSDEDSVAGRNKQAERRVQNEEDSVTVSDEDSLTRRNKYTKRRVQNDEDSVDERNKYVERIMQNTQDLIDEGNKDAKISRRIAQDYENSIAGRNRKDCFPVAERKDSKRILQNNDKDAEKSKRLVQNDEDSVDEENEDNSNFTHFEIHYNCDEMINNDYYPSDDDCGLQDIDCDNYLKSNENETKSNREIVNDNTCIESNLRNKKPEKINTSSQSILSRLSIQNNKEIEEVNLCSESNSPAHQIENYDANTESNSSVHQIGNYDGNTETSNEEMERYFPSQKNNRKEITNIFNDEDYFPIKSKNNKEKTSAIIDAECSSSGSSKNNEKTSVTYNELCFSSSLKKNTDKDRFPSESTEKINIISDEDSLPSESNKYKEKSYVINDEDSGESNKYKEKINVDSIPSARNKSKEKSYLITDEDSNNYREKINLISDEDSCPLESNKNKEKNKILSDEDSLPSESNKNKKKSYLISDEDTEDCFPTHSDRNGAPTIIPDEVTEDTHFIPIDNYTEDYPEQILHPRLSELRYSEPKKRSLNPNSFFEDTFANLLDRTDVIAAIEKNLEENYNERFETESSVRKDKQQLSGRNESQTISESPETITSEEFSGSKRKKNSNSELPQSKRKKEETRRILSPSPKTILHNLTPQRVTNGSFETPNGRIIMKTGNITPVPDYDGMNTPRLHRELAKFGLKRMKRKRGIELLKYIYESTHPMLDDGGGKVKRRRLDLDDKNCDGVTENNENRDVVIDDRNDLGRCGLIVNQNRQDAISIKCIGDNVNAGESVESMIFEQKRSKRVLSCQVPLHIAWYNFLSVNPDIHENILLYEPLQLEVLYSMLKEQGFKYNIKDLISFLDKKCITVRMKQN